MSERDSSFDVGVLLGGRYQLVDELGAGGMATAFGARDTNMRDRPVVVKVPHAPLAAVPKFRKRFAREIDALIGMAHPHVVPILDQGVHESVPYLVLQYMSQGSLADRIEEDGPQELDLVVPWLSDMARALDHIHESGGVHRDVKPDNILLDEHGMAYLADFGISKVADVEGPPLTATTGTLGTPTYMAPEQMDTNTVGPASDQYALAITAFEALTGELPFEGETPIAQLRAKDGGHLRLARVAEGPRAAVARALSRQPDDRFPTCSAFVSALAAPASQPPALASAGKPLPWRAFTIGALVFAVGAALFFGMQAREGRDRTAPGKEGNAPPPSTAAIDTAPDAQMIALHREAIRSLVGAARPPRALYEYLGARLKRHGAEPFEGMEDWHDGFEHGGQEGANVIGRLTGLSTWNSADGMGEYILVLAPVDGVDKEASAATLAAWLGLFRGISPRFREDEPPFRDAIFVAVDFQQGGPVGAKRLTDTMPLDACRGVIYLGNLHRAVGGTDDRSVLAWGAEHSAMLQYALGKHPSCVDLDLATMTVPRGGQPFRDLGIPVLHFGTEWGRRADRAVASNETLAVKLAPVAGVLWTLVAERKPLGERLQRKPTPALLQGLDELAARLGLDVAFRQRVRAAKGARPVAPSEWTALQVEARQLLQQLPAIQDTPVPAKGH